MLQLIPIMAHHIIGMIPARFGSSRFPGKPLSLISGKSLIQRTYENSLKCRLLDQVIVATDDARIFNHVKEFGGRAVMTSACCKTGTERIAEAIHKNFSKVEIVVNIQGDEPIIETQVIESVIKTLEDDPVAVMSTAVVPIRSKDEALDRSVNKCVMDVDGNALYFSRSLIPSGHAGSWDPNINYYKHLGIYGYRRDFLFHYSELSPTPLQLAEDLEQLKVLEHGFRIKVSVVESRSIGVDTPDDIKKIERMI